MYLIEYVQSYQWPMKPYKYYFLLKKNDKKQVSFV